MAFGDSLNKATGTVSEFEKGLKQLLAPTKKLTGIFGYMDTVLGKMQSMVGSFSEVQNAAIELARTTGLAGKSIMAIATRTIEQNRQMQLSAAYNMSSPEMIQMQQMMMARIGRNVAIDQVGTVQRNANGEVVNPNFDSELENLIAASKVFGEANVAEIVAGFDKLGKSMKSAAKYTGKLFQEAGEYGINLDKYVQNFTSNLEMAQNYNFRKGVDGLKEMARKATEIRQDMRQIAQFADKVGSVTGAVETAAQLQVLGGSFSSLANPLSMLNESLTDMEGLQKRLASMTEGMATYNQTTHQIEMSPYDRMRLKRAAEAMGIDPNNLIDQAYAQARRTEIQNQMMGMGNLTADFKKMAVNMGTIDSETGAAGVTVNGEFKSFSDIAQMSAKQQEELQKQMIEENRSESEDIKVIAKSVMGIEQIISGRRKQIANAAAAAEIAPGAVNGLSTYDMALRFVTEEFNPQLEAAAVKIQSIVGSLEAFTSTTLNTAGFGIVGTLGANSPEEFGKAWSDLTEKLFGTTPAVKEFGNTIGNIAEDVAAFFERINAYTEPRGLNMLGHEAGTVNGTPGRETPPVARSTQADAATVLATQQDSIREATHRALNGGRNPIFEPIERLAAMFGAPVMFSGTENSVPGVTVTPTGGAIQPQSQQATQTGNGATTSSPYNLNISGNLTMTVNGDRGNIGTVDIVKMIQQDADFRRMLAIEIAKAMEEVDSR